MFISMRANLYIAVRLLLGRVLGGSEVCRAQQRAADHSAYIHLTFLLSAAVLSDIFYHLLLPPSV
jgi:hypothetical protein